MVLNGVIYGIDIARGSSRSRQFPRYGLAILIGDTVSHHPMIRLHRIM